MDRLCDARVVCGNHHQARLHCCAITIVLCSLAPAGCFAQADASKPLPDAPSRSAQSQTAPQTTNPLTGGIHLVQLLERKSLVFPDLATNKTPFGTGDKFKLAVNNSVSLAAIGAAAVSAAYGQAVDTPEGYGQGAEGYGKRFGSGMARVASANLFGTFAIASVMHEDPRFYVRKGLSFGQTVKYSAVRIAITRSDSGKPVIDFAGLVGPLAGEFLANTYFPEGNRGVSDALIRYAADLGWKFGGNLLRQYWPSINRKLRLLPSGPEPTPEPATEKRD
ncbi:MAG TPA: hypothetical protein VGG62_15490 [Terracidiphilus sp.]|jgi:hypothetical protein